MRQALFLVLIFFFGSVGAQVINRAEYFIDTDPGKGNGTAIVVTSPSTNVNFNFTVPVTSLANGFHALGFRSRESITGFWSHSAYNTFFIVPPASTQNAINITQAEYFIDIDPGNGSGVNVAIGTVPNPSVAFTVPLTSLPAGFHSLHFRTRDDQNKWSIAHIQTFYIVPPPTGGASTNLVKAEYFFDADPGQGSGTALPITSAASQTNSFPISINGLPAGFHRLNIRYKDNAGTWSHAHQQIFYITPQNSFTATNIVRIEYYVDTDPGFGLGAAAIFTAGPAVDLLPLTVNTTGIPSGNHVLYVRAKDDKGFWSDLSTETFTISNCIPPTQPTVADQSRCGEGTITLTATGATGLQEYHWYDDPILNNQIGSGATFITPSLTTSRKYYVSIFDPSTSCESARTEVDVTVTVIAKPSLNVSGSVQFCEGNSIIINAPVGLSFYLWSNGATSQTINASTSGNYTVSVSNDGICFSPSSDPVNVTVLTGPAKPTIQVTGNTVLCGVGSTTLSGPTGLQYLWSTGATTQDIIVTQSGIYSLTVRSGGGCSSVASDPVSITTGGDQAIITQSGDLLIANAGDSYKWFLNGAQISGATSQVLEIGVTEFGIYAVEVNDNGCISRSEDFEYLITSTDEDTIKIKWYPNPIVEEFTIESPPNITYDLCIIDMLGRERIKFSDNGSTKQTISLKDLQSGSYILILQSDQSKNYFKIVKQ